MNNKYQDALEKMFYYNMMPNDITEEELKECDKLLQELVNIYPKYLKLKARATPKRPEMIVMKGFNDQLENHLGCQICKKQIINVYSNKNCRPKFCYHCGQALDWEDI